MSKGSERRPSAVSGDHYRNEHDRIFKRPDCNALITGLTAAEPDEARSQALYRDLQDPMFAYFFCKASGG